MHPWHGLEFATVKSFVSLTLTKVKSEQSSYPSLSIALSSE